MNTDKIIIRRITYLPIHFSKIRSLAGLQRQRSRILNIAGLKNYKASFIP